jgi:hypothetical protein
MRHRTENASRSPQNTKQKCHKIVGNNIVLLQICPSPLFFCVSFISFSLFLSSFLLPILAERVVLDQGYRLQRNTRFTNFKRGPKTPIWKRGHAYPGAHITWYVVSLGCVFLLCQACGHCFLRHSRIVQFISDLVSGHSLTEQYGPLQAHISRNSFSLTHFSLFAGLRHLPTHMLPLGSLLHGQLTQWSTSLHFGHHFAAPSVCQII